MCLPCISRPFLTSQTFSFNIPWPSYPAVPRVQNRSRFSQNGPAMLTEVWASGFGPREGGRVRRLLKKRQKHRKGRTWCNAIHILRTRIEPQRWIQIASFFCIVRWICFSLPLPGLMENDDALNTTTSTLVDL